MSESKRLYFTGDLYDFASNYDVESIKQELNSLNRYLNKLGDMADTILEHKQELTRHLMDVQSIQTVPVVILQRRVTYKNAVKFQVWVRHEPAVEGMDGETVRVHQTDDKLFEGKDRAAAIRYAKELAIKYDAEIRTFGMGDKKISVPV